MINVVQRQGDLCLDGREAGSSFQFHYGAIYWECATI